MVFGKIILKDTPTNQQYGVTLLSIDGEQAITPHDIAGYYDGRVLRMSKSLFVDGRVQQLFVEEAGAVGDAFIFFKFLNPQGEAEYYYQKVAQLSEEGGETALLLPVKGKGDEVFAAELTDYLKQYPAFRSKRAQSYIRRSTPTYKRFQSLYQMSIADRTKNLPPTFRWGVSAGGGMVFFEDSDFSMNDIDPHALFGLFAEWYIANGFSVRPELTYRSYSHSDLRFFYYKYKRQDLTPGLLVRYTKVSYKGKWLPYVQVGIDYNLALSADWYNPRLARQDNERAKTQTISLVGGVGLEYKLNPRHSLFMDLRYRKELFEISRDGLYLSLSYNL
ncbi:MAG: porin family protein [Prevotellaceae bacterium]|nr:porin family protein [Prevotellaceae bacterium]